MDSAVQFLVAVIVVPGVFAFGAWSAIELRAIRRSQQEHERDDRNTFQTKEAASKFEHHIDRRLFDLQRDISAIRQAVAPLPNQQEGAE